MELTLVSSAMTAVRQCYIIDLDAVVVVTRWERLSWLVDNNDVDLCRSGTEQLAVIGPQPPLKGPSPALARCLQACPLPLHKPLQAYARSRWQ